MSPTVEDMVAAAQRERKSLRERVTRVLRQVGLDCSQRDLASMSIHQGHDVHAFYTLNHDPSQVIHVQGYPGMSTEQEMRVYARMMDSDRMEAARASGSVSIGNEHEAVTRSFPNFEIGIMIPYDPDILQKELAKNVTELR